MIKKMLKMQSKISFFHLIAYEISLWLNEHASVRKKCEVHWNPSPSYKKEKKCSASETDCLGLMPQYNHSISIIFKHCHTTNK